MPPRAPKSTTRTPGPNNSLYPLAYEIGAGSQGLYGAVARARWWSRGSARREAIHGDADATTGGLLQYNGGCSGSAS
jgi:hypothetical protein